jgi:hypothetical protein
MVCGLSDSLLILDRTGIKVQPYEITVESNKTRYSHARIKVSRPAGELVKNRGEIGEPAYLTINGIQQDRYYLDEEAVELKNSEAWITLYDGMKVLDSGAINRHFHDVTLEDVVDYVVERRDDKYNVVRDVVHPDFEEPINVRNMRGEVFGQDNEGGGLLDDFADFVKESLIGFGGWLTELRTQVKAKDTSIGFKDTTALSALQRIEDQFLVTFWLDPDGYLHYTPTSVVPGHAFVIGADEDAIKLKAYNVTITGSKTNRVRLKGNYRYLAPQPAQSGTAFREVNSGLYAYGEAWIPGMAGSTHAPEEPTNIDEPVPLEGAARRKLLEEFMKHKSGNIVINSGASEQQEGLVKIAVGDTVLARAEIEAHCDREIDTGLFVVSGVTHRVNTRKGWETVIQVSGIPSGQIKQKSWLMDPKDNTLYEDIEDYLGERAQALNEDQLEGQDGGS